MASTSDTAVKESFNTANNFLKAAADLPPLMRMVILYCFLLAAILFAAIFQKSWTLAYIVAIGLMITFMVFMVFYMIKPPVTDIALRRGPGARSSRIKPEKVSA